MEMIGYQNPFYPVEPGYGESEYGMDRFLKSVGFGLDDDEMNDLKEQKKERDRMRREKACKQAQRMLKRASHPVNREDMLNTMDTAIMQRVSAFEQNSSIRNATMLLAAIICRNILTDGPLYEGE